jgi:hypothetical protein
MKEDEIKPQKLSFFSIATHFLVELEERESK